MSEPMSEERLAELRANVERAEENTKWYGPLGYNGEMERDCLAEIDRLRAEIAALTARLDEHRCGESDNHGFRRRAIVDPMARLEAMG